MWSQQAKLVGTGAVGPAFQGYSVSLSDDGSTAILGGPFDNSSSGAAWSFTRSGGVRSQQAKLVVFESSVRNQKVRAESGLNLSQNSFLISVSQKGIIRLSFERVYGD
jgi:hypothetical protein